ncbi:hypothetical protein KR018_010903 [Drosophila ironensis]|nr:hypothetical protein KR018_010903 [Drosophila ironensis]
MKLLLVCSALLAGIALVQGAVVMSVDLGTEWMKVGVVSPGVPMEIALNRESKRKTPAVLAFRNGVRTFGEDAQTIGVKDPSSSYGYLLDLLGKTIDNPIVDLYRKRFPYYDIVGDPERNTVVFRKSDTEEFSVEELVAQMLTKAKQFAQESAQQPVAQCVLTVPGYFGLAEREALLAAAQLANLKVLQLINDYTAVALNYGVFHRGEINETAQYFLFYDMGAYKTSAAVVSYQMVKDKQSKEINPVVQVLGVGYDRTLGGLEIQLRLRDYLAAEFNAMKKTKTDVTTSPRALAKLFKEAGRVKNVLSANTEHYAQIENVMEDIDFRVLVKREKLEELCADLWPRTVKPIEQALASSHLSLDVINQVILFGGGTRVPRVQETIKEVIKQELGKNLNADESATMGAVYRAAELGASFRVTKFVVKDAVLYPLQVSFERDPGDGAAVKQVKRVLFALMNPYPQKKVITFNKHIDDFEFFVNYADLDRYTSDDILALGSLNVTKVQLKEVKEVLEKSKKDAVDIKGIKAYFFLDDSGIFRCTGVEYVYDKQKPHDDADDDSTLSKLGSRLSKLFAKEGSDKADDKEEDHPTEEEPASTGEEPPRAGADTTPDPEKPKPEDAEQKPETAAPQEDVDAKEKEKEKEKEEDKEKEKNETVKVVTVKNPVKYESQVQFIAPLAGSGYEKALTKLTAINKAEDERVRLESALNALESHIIEVQQKLDEKSYSSCATADEKEKLLAECAVLSEWLYEDLENPTPEIYEEKLAELKKLSDVFLNRHWEHEERPEAVKTLHGVIDIAQKFLANGRNLTKESNPEKDVYTEVEIETLAKAIQDTSEWLKTESAAQKKLPRNANIRLHVKDISEKMALLDREVKYLVNKLKIWKPKVKPVADKEEKKDGAAEEAVGSGDGKDAPQEEAPEAAAEEEKKPGEEVPAEEITPTPTEQLDDKVKNAHSEL